MPHPVSKVPSHLPSRLTISLWDFTWYTRTTPGEPFADLDVAFEQAVERGYNTVRICAMPFLLFGDHGIDTAALRFTSMGGDVGVRTRWYDAAGGAVLDGRAHLLELFRAAERHGCHVILSSWEYQQSPAFLEGPEWYEALMAVDPDDRHRVMAEAMSDLVQFLKDHGLAERIAYAELHNEVDLSRLSLAGGGGPADVYWPQRPFVESAVARMQERHPDILATTCYGIPPHLDIGAVPDNGEVAHFHIYVYGVLGALEKWAGVRAVDGFPSPELRSLLRDDAPDMASYEGKVDPWRLSATGVSASMFYSHDWMDTARWDRWLYENYGRWREAMSTAVDERLDVLARHARRTGTPLVIGEGWVGYTPLLAEFEDGPVGQGIAERAITRCIELGAWGAVLGSNSAPHHPGWDNVEWQRTWNRRLTLGDAAA
ncbi:cellulase-like family protein [Isoptericola sp. NPDC056573]|uniref:cellulase-like family protein n=1 Tax=Isoptericola sp. NPDC056573 TaxID=3345868 RepID=UPI00369949F0